ncbi:MAG: glutamate--tRNA ligase family protein [Bacteroidia bacterium]|nr:glutamate--tRNA ligase family protein [Bacteroidia bacterium]
MYHTRIAPTPSGFLHPGNLLNALLAWLMARSAGGTVRLRIDDLDAPRARPEYVEDIFRTLDWMGLDWDLGPQTVEEHLRSASQQHRLPLYEALLRQLTDAGAPVYACACSRRELALRPCPCRAQGWPLDRPDTAWRLHTPPDARAAWQDLALGPVSAALAEAMPDFVIRRRDGLPAYQIASLADDLSYGTTLVVRGQDLLSSTAAQLWLSACLGQAWQPAWLHHPLLRGLEGEKLSKSAGAQARPLRESGLQPPALYRMAAAWLGLDAGSRESLLAAFDPQQIVWKA